MTRYGKLFGQFCNLFELNKKNKMHTPCNQKKIKIQMNNVFRKDWKIGKENQAKSNQARKQRM